MAALKRLVSDGNWPRMRPAMPSRQMIWGAVAVASVLVAAISAISGATFGPPIQAAAPMPAPAAEARRDLDRRDQERPALDRLGEAVQTLNEGQERLLTRLTSLERRLDDMTGSVQRTAVPAAGPVGGPVGDAGAAEATPPAPATPPSAVAPPTQSSPAAPSATAAPAPVSAAPSASAEHAMAMARTTSAEAAASSKPAEAPASEPPPAQDQSATASVIAPADPALRTPKGDFGIDVGGATTFDGLRALWRSIRTTNPAMFDELNPLVTVHESAKTRTPQLRLILGPFATPDAAEQACAMLTAARRHCQPATFEGARLGGSAAAAPTTPPRRPTAESRAKGADPRVKAADSRAKSVPAILLRTFR